MTTLQEIKKNIDNFNKMTVLHKPKIKIESDYALDQYNIKVNKLKYQEFISKNKKEIKKEHEINQFETGDKLMEAYEKTRYLRKWNKLDEYAKKIKLKEYFQKWINENTDTQYTEYDILNKYYDDIHNKKKVAVDYDDKIGQILSIIKWMEQWK
jgi:hypothetical protein